MKALITGAAGFIGYHAAKTLSRRGWDVVGVDSFTDYYSLDLKRARAADLGSAAAIHDLDIVDHEALSALVADVQPDVIVHLAAQAGVRHSLKDPFSYGHANMMGHLSVLETCRAAKGLSHLVYASSSSVYGGQPKTPFSEDLAVDKPVSLYAATKRADEMMSYTYAHLYGVKQIGLRFFTVYGEWGRPDMAYWLFTDRILRGQPIKVFNRGRMRRDFTYIDDILAGLCAVIEREPVVSDASAPHEVYNIGHNNPAELMRVIEILEDAIGRKAELIMEDMQPGEVLQTYADVSKISDAYGYSPTIDVESGLPRFVRWYKEYAHVKV